jgi:sulfoxide reductase heme-binding subunit YedZ
MKISHPLMRHFVVLLLALSLVYLFLIVHARWAPVHRWNRAFADASLVLLAVTMMIGPAVRLRNAWSRIVPWRRTFGIHALLLGVVHFLLILDGWIEWNIPRLFGLLVHPLHGGLVMVEHGFGLANVLGLVALMYGAILLITSNDRAITLIGGSVWKFIQSGAYIFWVLVLVHTAYFLFMHFLHFDRPLPDPNPLQWPFVGLVLAVVTLRAAATIRTWRIRRKDSLYAPSKNRA